MVTSYLLVRAQHGKEGIVKAALLKYDEIVEIDEVFGRYDIVAKVECESTELFSRFIKNKLRLIEGIKSVEPMLVADQ